MGWPRSADGDQPLSTPCVTRDAVAAHGGRAGHRHPVAAGPDQVPRASGDAESGPVGPQSARPRSELRRPRWRDRAAPGAPGAVAPRARAPVTRPGLFADLAPDGRNQTSRRPCRDVGPARIELGASGTTGPSSPAMRRLAWRSHAYRSRDPTSPPVPWTPRQPQQARYLVASDVSRAGVSLRPVFVGSLDPIASPLWSEPIWAVPGAHRSGVWIVPVHQQRGVGGSGDAHGGGLAIVPGGMVLAEADRLLAMRARRLRGLLASRCRT